MVPQAPIIINFIQLGGCNSTNHVLDLLLRSHQFKSHKPQGHWKLTWFVNFRAR